MIVKPTADEAKLLDRCLGYVADYVDEICITITRSLADDYGKLQCEHIANKYKAKVSEFKWVNDFAAARNFNFKQATGDYIIWLDADDMLKGAELLPALIDKMGKEKIDTGVMNYLYDFNDNKLCTTKHLKTRIVKNDGCVNWVGKIHEDFNDNRSLNPYFIADIEVIHLPTKKGIQESTERNIEIAKEYLKGNPEDPRSYWVMANALRMDNNTKAVKFYKEFIKRSYSDDEKYLAYLNISDMLKDKDYALQALALKPTYPDAYFKIADRLYGEKKYDAAINFIEIGFHQPIPDKDIIVYNPRDYDYNPLLMLMHIYSDIGKTEKALLIAMKMVKMFPNEPKLKKYQDMFEGDLKEVMEARKYAMEASEIVDKVKLKEYLDNLPEKVRQHPEICSIYNQNFHKDTSTGKDLVIYCSYTSKYWNPEIAMADGIGGSEEAVVNLAEKLSKDWNVTVYNNCKVPKRYGNVEYKNFWEYNVRDKQDMTILWRYPKPVDYDINSTHIVVDLHDVMPPAEFTKERLAKIDKIFVKTKSHRDLYPEIPDEKFAIIPNGVDAELFNDIVEKDPYLIINTSSADRHLEATLDIFEELIKRQPDKPWKLAWYYGWGVYDTMHADNQEMMDWKKKQAERFEKLKVDGRAEGGTMIGHRDIAKKYLEAGVFLYPTQFYEIHCISAVKAQLAGCKMATSDAFALAETVKPGIRKVHTDCERWNKENTFGDKQIDAYIELIENGFIGDKEWARETYNWDNVSNQWMKQLKSIQQ